MSRLLLFLLLLLAVPVAQANPELPPPPSADADAETWAAFSEGLVAALKSDNHGVRCSALQLLVAYGGDRVDVSDARFEVVRLFRDDPDPRVRLSALAALTQIDDRWVTDFLFRSARFQRDERLARLTYHAALASQKRTS